eukprot:TRINITY_DN35461_c0_g1_i2.p1 TRINITY_DN35461_c0_g1~~TRINITY_DN35461_c0_g1_i2.p1  ORF type:complete len:596 (-),score=55.08 TRINITY_DN35461_c0_g1_i2:176-1963(-)
MMRPRTSTVESGGIIGKIWTELTMRGVHCERQDDFSDMRRLGTTLPASLLRGVPAHQALAGYGRHWKAISGSSEDFTLSHPTPAIDDFISHDWRTPRVDKTVALCFVYNSTAAVVGSMLFALALTVFRVAVGSRDGMSQEPQPTVRSFASSGICTFTTPFVYLLLLFHWQAIRTKLLRGLALQSQPLLFLDKLCINQDDEDMKQQGILGLAAFLKSSRRLVLLWSPRYFTRLWCTYELATWCRLGMKAADTLLLPVRLPKFVLVGTLSCTFLGCARRAGFFLSKLGGRGDVAGFAVLMTFQFCVIFFIVVGVTYVLQGLQLDLEKLNEQLALFTILDAECFCCSNSHVHPTTHAKLPCDRKLVYRTLKDWHGCTETKDAAEREEQATKSADGSTQITDGDDYEYLYAFDDGVRTLLRDLMMTLVSSQTVQLKYLQIITGAVPLLWDCFDTVANALLRGVPTWTVLANLVDGVTVTLVICPLSVVLLCGTMNMTSRLHHPCNPEHRLRRLLLAVFVWSPLLTLIIMLLWIPMALLFFLEMPWALFLWSLVLASMLRYLLATRKLGNEDHTEKADSNCASQLHCSESEEIASELTSV